MEHLNDIDVRMQFEMNASNEQPEPIEEVSSVWADFTKYKNELGMRRAKCKHCGNDYAADPNRNGTSSLKKHIAKCLKHPDVLKKQTNVYVKQSLEGSSVSGAVKAWSYDEKVIRDALTRMVIIDELPFSFVEKEGFRGFMEALCPTFRVPSRHTISRDCAQLFLQEKMKLKNFFEKSNQRVSLTTDTWTSIQNVNYMCLTSHFIDDSWVLHKRILNFTPIFSHKGEEVGRAVEKCLNDWGITNVMTITVDNASSNDCAIGYLKEKLEECLLNGRFLHMRCVAHIINLVVKDGLKDHNESISRVRAAVKFIRQSPSRLEAFKRCVKDSNIECKGLLSLDCPTRWNSTFDMLDKAQKFEKAFNAYERQDLTYKHELGNSCGVPTRSDWQKVRHFASFLEIFYNLTKKVSGTSYTTCNLFFDEIVEVDFHLREFAKIGDYLFKDMALKMREKFDKYWGNVEKMNMLLYVAVVVDPRYKMALIEASFENLSKESRVEDVPNFSLHLSESEGKPLWQRMIELVDSSVRDVFNEYLKKCGPLYQEKQQIKLSQGNSMQHKSRMRQVLVQQNLESNNGTIKSELDRYLLEAREDDIDGFDILGWWRNNSARFPVLSTMARDILAIPISTVASESAFSTGGRVLDSFRSSLSPPLVESLICTQDWIRKEREEIKVEQDLEKLDELAKELCGGFDDGETSVCGGREAS